MRDGDKMTGIPGFWRDFKQENRRAVLYEQGINSVWYLFPQGNGPRNSFATFASLAPNLRSRDMILISGVLQEQAVCPVGVFDVYVLGAANEPRQATTSGVPTGGGASWLAPTTPVATTPLLRVINQGWIFENIEFSPVAGAAALTFDRRETLVIPDSSHGVVRGCYFNAGGAGGIGVEGIEVKKLVIEDCVFEATGGATGIAIKTTAGSGVAAPGHWTIRRNKFVQCINDVSCAGLVFGSIMDNTFFSTNPIEGGTRVVLTGAAGRNRVLNNNFSDVAADVTIAKGYTPATNDVWRNWTSNTNVPIVTVPT